MQIQDIYTQYNLMPQLITHQLRVGAIATFITQGWSDRELAHETVLSSLLHDMGNMAKFKLDKPVMPIENLAYWQAEQQRFWDTYGTEAHAATYAILHELKLDKITKYLLAESMFYDNRNVTRDSFVVAPRPAVVVLYGDLRVAIDGVVSLEERLVDLERRYGGVRPERAWANDLEAYIASLSCGDIRAITEATVAPLFDELLTLTV
jgi:hypothetical protein